jgi:hypothetical protein
MSEANDYLEIILMEYQGIQDNRDGIEKAIKNCREEDLKPDGEQMLFSAAQFSKELRLLCAQYESEFIELEYALKPEIKNATAGPGFERGVGATNMPEMANNILKGHSKGVN